jgi:hypothetical protein
MCQYIGAVITKRYILSLLCLFIMTSPFNKDVEIGKGYSFLTQKRQVQSSNNFRPPQCQTRKAK